MNLLTLLTILISLCLRADAAWQPYAGNFYSAEKKDVAPYVQEISQAYYDIGAFAPGGHPITVVFSYRIAPSARILGMTMVQPGGMCMRVIALNGPIRYPSNPFYGTPIWYGTLAHEIGHVYQGAGCRNNIYKVENGAEVAMFIIMARLAESDDVAKAGLVFEFRREIILATMDLLNKAKETGLTPPITPQELLDKLQLTDKEKAYFGYFIRNPASLRSTGAVYWTAAVQKILAEYYDEDGDNFCKLSFGGDPCFDGSALIRFLDSLLE